MKKTIAKLILPVFMFSALFFSGCDTSKILDLKSAIKKTNEAQSITSSLSAQFVDKSVNTHSELNPTAKNKIGLTAITRYMKDGTVYKMDTDATITADGASIPIFLYASLDENNSSNLDALLKIPAINDVPAEYRGKYISINGSELNSVGVPVENKATDIQKEYYEKLISMVQKYIEMDPTAYKDIDVVKDVNVVNAEGSFKATKYTVTLDNDTLLKSISYYVNTAAKDDAFLKTFWEMASKTEGKSVPKYDEFKKEVETQLVEFNKEMSSTKVKILGDKGVEIRFYVNADGYLISSDGTFDISNGTDQNSSNIEISFNANYYNINKTVVNRPAVDNKDIIPLKKFVNDMMGTGSTVKPPKPTVPERPVTYLPAHVYKIKGADYIKMDALKYYSSWYTLKYDKKTNKCVITNKNTKRSITVVAYKETKTVKVKGKKTQVTTIYLPTKDFKKIDTAIDTSNNNPW